MRTWKMHAGRDVHNGGFEHFGDPRYVQLYGHEEVVEVVCTEDPEGTYWGWLGAAYLHYPADEKPRMIYGHRGIFEIQFAYGSQAEVDRGHGEVVCLKVQESTGQEPDDVVE